MSNEVIKEMVTVQDVIKQDGVDDRPNQLKLEVGEFNKFTGVSETFNINLTRTNDDGKFDKKKLKRAFDILEEQTDEELEVPKNVSMTSVKEALKPIKGKEIEIYVGEREVKNEENETTGYANYYTLFEPRSFEFINANKSVSDLVDQRGIQSGDKIKAKPVAFTIEHNNSVFEGGKRKEAQMIEESETRYGLAKYIYGILQKDEESTNAKQARERLTDYMNKYKNANGEFIGTTSGILKAVNMFSKNKNTEGVDRYVKMMLGNMLNSNQSEGRIHASSVRLLINVDGEKEDDIYKTKALKELSFPAHGEKYKVTFNPKDTNFMEFAKFIEPLYSIDAIKEDDFEELQKMTNPYDIINKLEEVIKRENLIAHLSVGNVSNNYFFNLLNLEHSDEEINIQASNQQDTKDEPMNESMNEPMNEVSETQEQANEEENNPFVKEDGSSLEIDDDDLPF